MSQTPLTPQDLDRIALYVDGGLETADVEAFEREMLQRPQVRAEVEALRGVDAALGRLFDDGTLAAKPGVPARTGTWRWFALAAGLLLAAGLAFYALRPDPLLIRPETVWANVERAGFTPSWKCVDDAEFRAYLTSRLGESFTIAETPGLQVVGWAYGKDYAKYPLSKDTLILINKVGDDHSVVMIDRIAHEKTLKVDPDSGLHLFTRRVGGLVLYELTPRDQPAVLDAVRT